MTKPGPYSMKKASDPECHSCPLLVGGDPFAKDKETSRLKDALELLKEYERWDGRLAENNEAWQQGCFLSVDDLRALIAIGQKRHTLLHPKE